MISLTLKQKYALAIISFTVLFLSRAALSNHNPTLQSLRLGFEMLTITSLGLMIYGCFLLLSAKRRSQWWLVLLIFLNVLGFVVILVLQDRSEPRKESITAAVADIAMEKNAIGAEDSDNQQG
jgi:peptidoglycan/LPS O-acetylase OafA/YrhL